MKCKNTFLQLVVENVNIEVKHKYINIYICVQYLRECNFLQSTTEYKCVHKSQNSVTNLKLLLELGQVVEL